MGAGLTPSGAAERRDSAAHGSIGEVATAHSRVRLAGTACDAESGPGQLLKIVAVAL